MKKSVAYLRLRRFVEKHDAPEDVIEALTVLKPAVTFGRNKGSKNKQYTPAERWAKKMPDFSEHDVENAR